MFTSDLDESSQWTQDENYTLCIIDGKVGAKNGYMLCPNSCI